MGVLGVVGGGGGRDRQLKRLLNSGQPPTDQESFGDGRWEEAGVSGMVQGAVVEELAVTFNVPVLRSHHPVPISTTACPDHIPQPPPPPPSKLA